jgi:hypothetical protein
MIRAKKVAMIFLAGAKISAANIDVLPSGRFISI